MQISLMVSFLYMCTHYTLFVCTFLLICIVPKIELPGALYINFYSVDCKEPIHVHVEFQGSKCKVWIESMTVAWHKGFKPYQLNRIVKLLKRHEKTIRGVWDAHCRQEKSK